MPTPLLQTKLYIPPYRPRERVVPRPRLIERLNAGLYGKLTLISAPAGFGKTTLLSEWVAGCEPSARVAWLSLDKGDNDLARFLTYLVAALRTIEASIGRGVLAVLQSPSPINAEAILTTLINEIASLIDRLILVLDDYHAIESQAVDRTLTFVLDHLPPQLHLVVASRTDPTLPLSRLRARGQLTELRAGDLRFTTDEATAFLKQVARLPISPDDVHTLETRTEGWITGLQLAAVAMQGLEQRDQIVRFIHSFGASHRYVIDYLVDEVLDQQPPIVQEFLLQTSVLDRMVAPLCDTVARREDSQAMLEALEAANLFLIPLDGERRWYRYHHLFADLLRQRLQQQQPDHVAELHVRASAWYEDNDLVIEAFHHAAAANDVERAERLIAGEGVPLQYRGAGATVLDWLETLPTTILDARPSLWVTYASVSNLTGQPAGAEQKLQAAEAALGSTEPDDKTNDLIGHIAAIRAMMAVGQHQLETIIAQSRLALEYLHPNNLPVRTITAWTLGYAYQLQGDRAAASRAYTKVLSTSQASGDIISTLAAAVGLGNIQESENQLFLAAESYRHGMQLFGDHPQPAACGAYLGLARILYEWNDLDAAQQHAQQSLQLAQQVETIDTPALCWLLLARLKLAQGDVAGATALLAEADKFVRQNSFMHRIPEVAAAQVRLLLHQGDLAAAAHLAEKHDLPSSQARIHLAQGEASAALAVLEPLRQQVEAEGWEDEQLKVLVLHVVALLAHGEREEAVHLLGDALALAEPGGLIRIFVDEGSPMADVLSEAAVQGIMPDYTDKLLAAFEAEEQPVLAAHQASPGKSEGQSFLPPAAPAQPLVEPLSERELQVLQLIAQGFSNREISERLFIALDTVKGHNRKIYGKLGVKNRTQAINKARSLNLLPPQ